MSTTHILRARDLVLSGSAYVNGVLATSQHVMVSGGPVVLSTDHAIAWKSTRFDGSHPRQYKNKTIYLGKSGCRLGIDVVSGDLVELEGTKNFDGIYLVERTSDAVRLHGRPGPDDNYSPPALACVLSPVGWGQFMTKRRMCTVRVVSLTLLRLYQGKLAYSTYINGASDLAVREIATRPSSFQVIDTDDDRVMVSPLVIVKSPGDVVVGDISTGISYRVHNKSDVSVDILDPDGHVIISLLLQCHCLLTSTGDGDWIHA